MNELLKSLSENWTIGNNYESSIQKRIWDRRAEDFDAHPLPSFEKDDFLRLMCEEMPLAKEMQTLDVGCGAGRYSIALAEKVGHAFGVDISPNMITAAKKRAETMGIDNCSFEAVDWAIADIDSMGFRGAFDIVFAHMTPAICDFSTLDKMNSCSRGLCMLKKPTRRTNLVQDACYALAGLSGEKNLDKNLINIFTYAWGMGYEPKLFYNTEIWHSEQDTEEFYLWISDRIRLRNGLGDEEAEKIHRYLKECEDENGKIKEETVTTNVTMIWSVKN